MVNGWLIDCLTWLMVVDHAWLEWIAANPIFYGWVDRSLMRPTGHPDNPVHLNPAPVRPSNTRPWPISWWRNCPHRPAAQTNLNDCTMEMGPELCRASSKAEAALPNGGMNIWSLLGYREGTAVCSRVTKGTAMLQHLWMILTKMDAKGWTTID